MHFFFVPFSQHVEYFIFHMLDIVDRYFNKPLLLFSCRQPKKRKPWGVVTFCLWLLWSQMMWQWFLPHKVSLWLKALSHRLAVLFFLFLLLFLFWCFENSIQAKANGQSYNNYIIFGLWQDLAYHNVYISLMCVLTCKNNDQQMCKKPSTTLEISSKQMDNQMLQCQASVIERLNMKHLLRA